MTIDIAESFLEPLKCLTNKNILITGGNGFVGTHIVELLQLVNANITIYDVVHNKHKPHDTTNVKTIIGNLVNYNDVYSALSDMDAVIHTASPSPVSRNTELFNSVNINGTENIIKACKQHNITTLVYTSSASVVYDGTDQMNYDESCSIPHNKLDSYTTSKLAAEQLVLDANTTNKLHTVALRPHGIFGPYPHDPYAITGMTNAGLQGKSKYMFGAGNNLVDWTYVVNVAYAHVLATAVLVTQKNSNAYGQAYFITNQQPTYFWDLPSHVYTSLNVPTPYIQLPVGVMKYIASQWETVGRYIPLLKPPQSFTSQAVIYGTTHHYYNSLKAQHELGYIPPVTLDDGFQRVTQSVKHLRKSTPVSSRHITASTLYGIIFILLIALFVTGNTSEQLIALLITAVILYRLYRTSTFGESVNLADTDIDLSGKTVLLTGGNKGIGYYSALGLCQRGAHVYIATRDETRGNDAVKSIRNTYKQAKIDRLQLDLSSFDSVNKLVDTLKKRNITIDILVCNAAAMTELYRTPDNLDGQFQSNYLSHVLLCILCIHYNILSSTARIVHVSSLMHNVGQYPIDMDVLNGINNKSISRLQMYNNTKLYQIMFNKQLSHQLKRYNQYTNISTISVHPGACNTEFVDHFIPKWFHSAGNIILNSLVTRNALQGSQSVIYSACSKQLVGVTGIYIDNCEPRQSSRLSNNTLAIQSLWKLSIELCSKHLPDDCILIK